MRTAVQSKGSWDVGPVGNFTSRRICVIHVVLVALGAAWLQTTGERYPGRTVTCKAMDASKWVSLAILSSHERWVALRGSGAPSSRYREPLLAFASGR